MTDMIRIDHLQKHFGEVHAVRDLSFRVKEGELFAFLGVNGAGKSTTINIICGELKRTAAASRSAGRTLTVTPTASSAPSVSYSRIPSSTRTFR